MQVLLFNLPCKGEPSIFYPNYLPGRPWFEFFELSSVLPVDPFEVLRRKVLRSPSKPAIPRGFANGRSMSGPKPLSYGRLPAPLEVPLKLTVVYYHDRQSVLIDHDNMLKPIQDALAGLIYVNDRQITDAQTRKTNIDGRFRVRHLSAVYALAFGGGRVRLYQNRRGRATRSCYEACIDH